VYGVYKSKGGSEAERDNIRALVQQLDAIPATGDPRDEAEYAELEAEAEARREITNRNRDREMAPAPVEREPEPEGGRYAETEPLSEEELVEQETRYESRKSDVPPPPGGAEIPWAVPH
jgi:hypothetical protein